MPVADLTIRLLVQFVAQVLEDMEEGQVIDQRRWLISGKFLQPREESGFLLIGGRQRIPEAREP